MCWGCACGGCACPLAALDARAVMSPRGCRPPVALSLCSVPVEFPAVLLNAATGRIEAEFHTFVQPQEQPVLSEFCTTLTGVTQKQVDEGVPLHICLSQFLKWLQEIQKEKKILFSSDIPRNAIPEAKLCTFVTWTGLSCSDGCKAAAPTTPSQVCCYVAVHLLAQLLVCLLVW